VNIVLNTCSLTCSTSLQLVQGDLTAETTDAIVNAANEDLQHGGGVAWAIVRSGGEIIQQESDEWIRDHGPVSHGSPAWTSAGTLRCRYIIHAVGPVWGDGQEDAKLTTAVSGSLRVADELKLTSVSLPAISTGIFGFPKELAAGIILDSVVRYFKDTPGSGIKIIRLVVYDQATLMAFIKGWDDHFSAKP
jgi:O-acetyl-ADP-ribose deacetylase (regulator of RNase III)